MAASHKSGLLLILTITYVLGFNIDTKIPFIRRGDGKSYFGFSLAEHQITDSLNNVIENVLLVGAPKYVRNGNQIGGLYKCNFNSWCESTCDYQLQAEADDVTAITGNRTDQWFGSVVRSSGKGGHVVVCAHRFNIDYSGIGKCTALRQSLTFNRNVMPCNVDVREHEGTSFCQAGTAADVNSDGTVVVGGPGAGIWTGGVFTLLVKRTLGAALIYYSSPWQEEAGRPKPPIEFNSYMGYAVTSGHYFSTDPRQVLYVGGAPHANETGVVVLFYQQVGGYLNYRDNQIIHGIESFSLFGFDLATVDLNNDGYDDLIVGAPMYYVRSKAGGAIYVYMGSAQGIGSNTKPIKITSQKKSENECKKFMCTESRFGFSVSPAGDINLDGYQDLVVGAPYEGEGRGAVYLFHGSKDGIVEKYAQRIYAADVDPSDTIRTFGYSVGGQLDLDQNGYDDISVGAYQSDKAYLLRTRPIIRLSANLTVSPMKFNLSQPKSCNISNELGKKHCIDLYLCMSFTAKPENSFNTLQKIFYKIELEKDLQVKRATFVNIDPLHPDGSIKEDRVDLPRQNTEKCKKEKIKLKDKFNDKLSPISFTVEYSLAELDFPSPNQCSDGVPDINKYPLLVTGEEKVTTLVSEVTFAKECGSNDICESDITMQTSLLNLTIPKRDDDGTVVLSYGEDTRVIVDIKLNNTGEPAYETNLYITVPPEFDFDDVDPIFPPFSKPPSSIINTTLVVIEGIGNPFGNQEKSTNYRHYQVKFASSNLPAGEERFSIIVKVNTTSQEQNTVGDVQEIKVRVINRAEVEVQGAAEPDGDVFFRGPARGVSVMKTESDIGPAINHTYRVLNHGPGTVGGATLRIYWPFELKTQFDQGRQLLYLMQDPVVIEGPAECPSYPEFVNTLDIEENPNEYIRTKNPTNDILTENPDAGPSYTVTDNTRKKRDTVISSTPPPKRLRKGELSSSKSIVHIGCNDKANCRVMECRIKGLKKDYQVKILLRARLWESTLVQEYSNSGEVWIHSEGMVILDSDLHIEQNTTDDRYTATTYTLPDLGPRVSQEIKWWIILVAVLAGLIVLVIVILIFWKCGFFKRLRPEGYQPTYKGDLKKTKDDAAYS